MASHFTKYLYLQQLPDGNIPGMEKNKTIGFCSLCINKEGDSWCKVDHLKAE
jgi:hypothetical protein